MRQKVDKETREKDLIMQDLLLAKKQWKPCVFKGNKNYDAWSILDMACTVYVNVCVCVCVCVCVWAYTTGKYNQKGHKKECEFQIFIQV